MEFERLPITTELRVKRNDGKAPVIEGYAAVFNALSEILYDFREEILPGAFAEAIVRDDVRGLFNHDANFVLGRNKSGTLKLSEDETGLYFEVTASDSQAVRDLVLTPIERGDINQMSFAFTADDQAWVKAGDDTRTDLPIRQIRKVHLYDVSVVTYPAYPQTTAQVRSYFQQFQQAAGGQAPAGDAVQAQVQAYLRKQRARMLFATQRESN